VNIFFQPLIRDGHHILDPEESRHCIKVLRKKTGDHIIIVDGKGTRYEAILTDDNFSKCEFRIIKKTAERPRKFRIHIAVGPTKNTDRIEWFVEKATEIGIDEISFIQCDHSERTNLRLDRIHRVAITAMKQSLKATLPVINELIAFSHFVRDRSEQEKFLAHVDSANPHHLKDVATAQTSYCVLIGPEGDFSTAELDLAEKSGFKKVSLGWSRLRTETAALVACHTLDLLNL
jgi:16S rRNA (uracil1498-N3)-methyltransferase